MPIWLVFYTFYLLNVAEGFYRHTQPMMLLFLASGVTESHGIDCKRKFYLFLSLDNLSSTGACKVSTVMLTALRGIEEEDWKRD